MTTDENRVDPQPENLLEMAKRVRRERDEKIAAMKVEIANREYKPHPALQRLIDTEDEFRERVKAHIDNIIASAPF